MTNAMIDSLKRALYDLLLAHPAGMSEYELLQALKDHRDLAAHRGSDNHALFCRHFLLQHTLYELQAELAAATTYCLEISALHNQLHPHSKVDSRQLTEANASLREFYLNLDNVANTDAEQVDKWLDNFWQRYQRFHQRDAALAILELPHDASPTSITKRFRQLATRLHPDRGGSAEQFAKVRAAYEKLKHRD